MIGMLGVPEVGRTPALQLEADRRNKMKKILMITEQPNQQASTLIHEELFDISKNPFSQFFGRVLFGNEKYFRRYFNHHFIQWMHARGSMCHGRSSNDGKSAIRKYIFEKKDSLRLIVAFGRNAAKVFLPNREANFASISNRYKKGLLDLAKINESFKDLRIPIAFLPHISGNAQKVWMDYADTFTIVVGEIQENVIEICNGRYA